MSKKLTEDQIQRAVWSWLDWVTAYSGTPEEGVAVDNGRNLAMEIKAGDERGSVDCSRENLMNTLDCLRKERESFIQEKMELRERISELMKERDDLKKDLEENRQREENITNLYEKDIQPIREYLGMSDYIAGDLAERILRRVRALEKERSDLRSHVDELLAEKKKVLFIMGAVDAK